MKHQKASLLMNLLFTKNNYKYNGKELQDELSLNWTAMDFRNYDASIGRFHNMDPLAEYSTSWTPYRFAYNNPVFWSDPTGLFEENFETCPTCPNKPEFRPFIDDPNNEFVYDPETNTVSEVIQLAEAEIVKYANVFSDVIESIGGGASSILNDRYSYGEGFSNKPIIISTKLGIGINTTAKQMEKLSKIGKTAGNISKGLVVADIALSGEIRASHVLTGAMIGVNAIPVIGNTISGIYFGADLITMGISYTISGEAKGIGDYLDESLNGGVIINAQDVGVEYEGVY